MELAAEIGEKLYRENQSLRRQIASINTTVADLEHIILLSSIKRNDSHHRCKSFHADSAFSSGGKHLKAKIEAEAASHKQTAAALLALQRTLSKLLAACRRRRQQDWVMRALKCNAQHRNSALRAAPTINPFHLRFTVAAFAAWRAWGAAAARSPTGPGKDKPRSDPSGCLNAAKYIPIGFGRF